jgi:hypothetical protein
LPEEDSTGISPFGSLVQINPPTVITLHSPVEQEASKTPYERVGLLMENRPVSQEKTGFIVE